MKEQLFARKTLAHYESDVKNSGLKRVLARWQLTALGIGAVIGAGIFVMTGLAPKDTQVPALALSFINRAMMLNLEVENWIRFFAWLGLGLVVYFSYGYKKSMFSKTNNLNTAKNE